MDIDELRLCPMLQARGLLYERFNKQTGPYTYVLESTLFSKSHFDLSTEIPMTTRDAHLIEENVKRASIYSVMTKWGEAYVLVDSSFKNGDKPGDLPVPYCFVTITSHSRDAVYETVGLIEQCTAYSDSKMQSWLRSQEDNHE